MLTNRREKDGGKRPDAIGTMQPASYLRNKITQDKEPSNAAFIAGLLLFPYVPRFLRRNIKKDSAEALSFYPL